MAAILNKKYLFGNVDSTAGNSRNFFYTTTQLDAINVQVEWFFSRQVERDHQQIKKGVFLKIHERIKLPSIDLRILSETVESLSIYFLNYHVNRLSIPGELPLYVGIV